jgi:hypothetical protein
MTTSHSVTHPDANLSAEALQSRHAAGGEHPDFSREDWRYEVANDDTRLGYWEWAMHKVEAWDPED